MTIISASLEGIIITEALDTIKRIWSLVSNLNFESIEVGPTPASTNACAFCVVFLQSNLELRFPIGSSHNISFFLSCFNYVGIC
jgi:hypothetical protein